MSDTQTETVVFGGGCFWCTEAVFQMLKGVTEVTPGYAGGDPNNANYAAVSSGTTGHAEVIQVTYDPGKISFRDLLTVFFGSHDPAQRNRQGSDVGEQYRSVIFYTSEAQREEAQAFIDELKQSGTEVVTELMPLDTFTPAEESHKDYYQRNSEAGYCQLIIEPKIEKVRKRFVELMKDAQA